MLARNQPERPWAALEHVGIQQISPIKLSIVKILPLPSNDAMSTGRADGTMQREIEFRTHSLNNEQRNQLDRAVTFFNIAQKIVVLREGCAVTLPTQSGSVLVEETYEAYAVLAPMLLVSGETLVDNWFTHADRGVGIMTLSDWEVAFISDTNGVGVAAPDAYILTSLALAILCIIGQVGDYDVIHDELSGCLFDLCAHKPDRIFKMRSGFVCQQCSSSLAERGVSALEIDAIHAVLESVRRLVLGRKPQTHFPPTPDEEDFLQKFSHSNKFELSPRLVGACHERNITVFVGSGLSLQDDVEVSYPDSCQWRRLPTWGEVPDRLAAQVKTYLGKKVEPRDTETLDQFLLDLDYFKETLGTQRYYPRAMFDIFTPEVTSVGLAHRMLYRLPIAAVVTTNYDFVLQCAAPAGTPVYTWKEARSAREYLEGGGKLKPLLKVHGCASRPDTVVLTRTEYETLQNDQEYAALVRSLFDRHVILFLGFGFNDPRDLDLALREAELGGAATAEKFAVLPRAKCAEVSSRFPQIQTIPLEQHHDLPVFLAELLVKSGRN